MSDKENAVVLAEVVDSPSISAIESVSRAEIDMQISTAKKYPRALSSVKKSMLEFATLDQETAESCFYSLPRGDKNIKGPSVRLAEIAVSCYGNLRAGSRAVETVSTGDSPHVVVQAVCHDLERNTLVTIEKRRRIVGKKKNGGKPDEDDINLATNACAAIAFRDAVFKVIPGALIKPVYEQAMKVAIGDVTTLSARRSKCIDTFGKMGITKDRVLVRLEKKSVEDIGLEDLETLIGLHTAIKDGATTLDDAFPAQAAQPKIPTSDGAKKLFPTKLAELESKMTADITESDILEFMRIAGLADDALSSLKEVNEMKPSAIEAALKTWPDVEKKIKKLKSAGGTKA